MTDTDRRTDPALTPDEWEQWQTGQRFIFSATEDRGVTMLNRTGIEHARRQGLAALALYQQPFGFTHDDVRGLRQSAQYCRVQSMTDPSGQHLASAEWFDRLADRIAALLPPSS